MAEDTSQDMGGSFDLDKLRELIEMMEKHDLTEVNLKRGDERWRLRRGSAEPMQFVSVPQAAAAPAAPAATGGGAPAETAPAVEDHSVTINSPTVGTYYSAPSPDDPDFVGVGSKVTPDTIVCIVEAMKVFNQIPAETSGTIVEILVKNGEAVDFGQPLFRVTPG